jgi:hypothetical protein
MTFIITTKATDFSTGSPKTEFCVEFGGPEAEAAFGGSPCSTSLFVPFGGDQVVSLKSELSSYCSSNNLPAFWTAYLDGKEI